MTVQMLLMFYVFCQKLSAVIHEIPESEFCKITEKMSTLAKPWHKQKSKKLFKTISG